MENSILKDAIQEIARLESSKNTVREIDGHTYLINSNDYEEIKPDPPKLPDSVRFLSLDGLVQVIKNEINVITEKTAGTGSTLYVNVESEKEVRVLTGLDENCRRATVYSAVCPRAGWDKSGLWTNHENFMIMLQSQFRPNDGTAYLLDFLSRITDENSVSSEDNGVTQTVQVKKGVALAAKEQIKPIVLLCPYRTFMEVEQPESLFLVRIREGGEVALFEADGGMWKFEARKRVKEYLTKELEELIKGGRVVVAM